MTQKNNIDLNAGREKALHFEQLLNSAVIGQAQPVRSLTIAIFFAWACLA